MKRFSDEHVEHTANAFARSTYADMWAIFADTLRAALIDSWIMGELRVATSVDVASRVVITPRDVVRFRDAVASRLALGIRVRGETRHYRISDEPLGVV